jgi:hypothetical protein
VVASSSSSSRSVRGGLKGPAPSVVALIVPFPERGPVPGPWRQEAFFKALVGDESSALGGAAV